MAKELAKAKYAAKVCGYLGIDIRHCERVFDKLYENMQKAFRAVKIEERPA